MVHQLNIVVLLLGSLQGLLLSLWLFRNHRKAISNIYMGVFITIIGLQLVSKVISKGWLMDNGYIFYALSYKLPYLALPAIYLFTKSRKTKSFSNHDILHVAPFIISSLFTLDPFGLKLNPHPYTDAFFQIVLLFVYYKKSLTSSDAHIKQHLIIFFIAEAIVIITLALMVMYYGRFPDVRVLFSILTVLMYWVSYQLINNSKLFAAESAAEIPLVISKPVKYAHSTLRSEDMEKIGKAIHYAMEHEKLYLNSNLSIDDLAKKISTSKHNVSRVLNELIEQSFNDYVNEFRLQEACKRLSDRSNLRFTIAAIANDSGFHAVSTFNDIFKKRFQTTPSKFREHALGKMSA